MSELVLINSGRDAVAYPSVTTLSNGRYVVASTGGFSVNASLSLRIFDGASSTSIPVNTTVGHGTESDVAALAAGHFAVTWKSDDSADGSGTLIRGRFFSGDGTGAGSDFVVNSTGAGDQSAPTIRMLAGGQIVVAWQSNDGGDGSGTAIRARLFNPDGSPQGADFVADTSALGDQLSPALAALNDGRFVATWQSADGGDGSGTLIRARIFEASGTPIGNDFVVNSTTLNNQLAPVAAPLVDGRFVIAWATEVSNGDSEVRARVFNADGSPNGSDLLVNSTAPHGASVSATVGGIAPLPDGGFVVTWTAQLPSLGINVSARAFDQDGHPFGREFVVNNPINSNTFTALPAISSLGDGNVVIVWEDNSSPDPRSFQVLGNVFNPEHGSEVLGTAMGDSIGGSPLADILSGLDGNDSITGGDGDDRILGGNQDDALNGGLGNDTLDGGPGNDSISGSFGTDTFVFAPGDGADTVTDFGFGTSAGAHELIDLRAFHSILTFNDILAHATDLPSGVFIDFGNGDSLSLVSVRVSGLTAGNFSLFIPPLTLFGTSNADILNGGDGNDVILGQEGSDTISGGGGDDNLSAGAGADVVFGGSGNDTIGGGLGDDTIVGQDGDDVIFGEEGADVANGGAGADVMIGGAGNDTFGGGADNDTVRGGDGDDLLFGEEGIDDINGQVGNDGVVGGPGDDILGGGVGNDIVVGDDGNDVLFGELGNDSMNGGFGNDILIGSDGDDVLGGGAGDDDLNGGFGNDTLFGENGNDILNGSAGNDILIGGGNDDTFVFQPGDGTDTIGDFFAGGPEDRIWFKGTDLHTFADVQAHATTVAGNIVITYNGFFTVTLNGVTAAQLTAADFIFT